MKGMLYYLLFGLSFKSDRVVGRAYNKIYRFYECSTNFGLMPDYGKCEKVCYVLFIFRIFPQFFIHVLNLFTSFYVRINLIFVLV